MKIHRRVLPAHVINEEDDQVGRAIGAADLGRRLTGNDTYDHCEQRSENGFCRDMHHQSLAVKPSRYAVGFAAGRGPLAFGNFIAPLRILALSFGLKSRFVIA